MNRTSGSPVSLGPILPVLVIDDDTRARDTCRALAAGGIGVAEIALRTPAALRAIEAAADDGALMVGAGTVVHPDDVDRIADAGARFVVSPGFDDDVVARCHARGIAVLPGVASATEVSHAIRTGVTTLKFFPADRLGGLATISALAGPFPDVRFVPSGGVSAVNLVEYLAHPSVSTVSGSWMATRASIAAREFGTIERLSRSAVTMATAVQ